jgi:hypothetical protein
MVPSLLFLTIVTRSTGHSANQTTRWCSGQQQPVLAFVLR